MKKMIRILLAIVALAGSSIVHAANDWSAQDYDLYAGDFDGDGKSDILYVAKDPSKPSGIAKSDGNGPNIPWQSWPSNYLNIPWSGNQYNVVVADFDGDGKADIFLQSQNPGNHYLLLTDSGGHVVGISEEIPDWFMGLYWSGGQHRIIAGDFNGDGRKDLFLQATSPAGMNAIVLTIAGGYIDRYQASANQSWNDTGAPGGFKWSTQNAIVYAGDFNHDGRWDLLVQAKPKFVTIDYDVPFPVPTYPLAMNGIVFSQTNGPMFASWPNYSGSLAMKSWDRIYDDVDWSTLSNSLVVSDFDGDGYTDVLVQAKYSSKTSYFLKADGSTNVFASKTNLPTTIGFSSDTSRLIAMPGVGLYYQALTLAGTNYISTSGLGTNMPAPAAQNPSNATGTVPATAVGHTGGSFAVSNGGAATYSIPITVPPGVSGVQPSLAITYSSGGGNGLLGMGWNLSGFSTIERCRKTWAQDGSTDGVALTTADLYCLDGNKMRQTNSGSYLYYQSGAQYQTEMETFSRITAMGTAGNGPAYFRVEGKDGLYYEYGSTADSRIESTASGYTSTSRVWALNKVSDRAGNTMTISYIEDGAPNGSFRPDEVLYTSNSNAGLNAAAKVKFFWDDRSDVLSGYFAGGLIKETKRLNRVETQYNSSGSFQLVRKYQLSYNAGSATSRSRLGAVQECDANGYCLAPTVFGWQDGAKGWPANDATVSSSLGSTALMQFAHAIDIDGDGISDLVYPDTVNGTIYWHYMLGTASGAFGSPMNTWIGAGDSTNQQYAFALPINAFGNGALGLLANVPGYSTRQVISWTGTGLWITNTNVTTALDGKQWVSDVNGDGLDDFIYAVVTGSQVSGTGSFYVQQNAGGGSFGSPASWYTQSVYWNLGNPFTGGTADSMRLVDVNGDGRGDIVYMLSDSGCANGFCWAYRWAYILISTGNSFSVMGWGGCSNGCDATIFTGDFNGDGLTDLAFNAALTSSTPSYQIGYSSGAGIVTQQSALSIPYSSGIKPIVVDYDGDGRMDILYWPTSGASWMVMRSNGTGGFDPPVSANIPATSSNTLRAADFDGDGLVDVAYQTSGSGYRWLKHNGALPDLLKSTTDGFSNSVNVTYAPLTDGNVYTKGSTALYPEVDFKGALYVVKQYTSTDGIGGSFAVNETYSGARLHLKGRGFEGFASRSETDSRTSIKTTTTFNQLFPKTGTVASITVAQPQPNGKTISSSSNSYTDLVTNGTQYSDRHFVYASGSAQTSYEVSTDTVLDGAAIKSVATSVNSMDAYGNATNVISTTTDLTGSGQTFTTTTSNTVTNDITNWCIGFVTNQQVTTSAPNAAQLDGNAAPTRTLKFDPDADPTKCRIYKQTLEPNTASQVVTTFLFDSFGHAWQTKVSATGVADRVASVSYGSQGVFAVDFTNAVGEISHKTYNYALGVPLTTTDPNGIQVSWQYDGFARKYRENAPDGTATTWTLSACNTGNGYCGDSLLRYRVQRQQLDGSANHNVVRTDYELYDMLNRVLYSQSLSLSGALSTVRSVYNNKRQLYQRSNAYFAGLYPVYTTYSYDLLGRPLQFQRQVSDTDASSQYVTYSYNKLSQAVTDPLNHTTTQTKNVVGQVVQVTDALGKNTGYQYDALGNLAKITDSKGNAVSSTFNVRGFKVTSSDPDMGSWVYDYYPTGELKTQTDAKSQVVSFTYDNTSRILTRTEPEGVTTFVYGASSTNHNIGKLDYVCMGTGANCTGQTYREAYIYDGLGRAQSIIYTEDTAYQVDYSYNNQGTLDTLTYPASTAGYRFKLQYAYTNGQLAQIRDYAAGTQFWTLNATNAANQVIDELYGNGVHVISGFDGITGAIAYRQSGNGGSTSNLQSLNYQWDKAGNLTQRQDVIQNLTETFYYDKSDGSFNLYRLDHSTLKVGSGSPSQNFSATYDELGNIVTKSDAGTFNYTTPQTGCSYYTYSQPHAVRAIGSNVYCYDANGNMTKRAGDTINWTSYNLPSQINSGSNYSQFSYGPSRQRWRQVANYGGTLETTIYVGGLIEKVTRGSVTEYKHYIPGGSSTAIYTRRSDSTTSIYYVASDHLGSADVITNGTGAAVVWESFAAFGARRGSNWSGTPSPSDQAQFTATTRHGYTGHEELDNLNLIHMNGRVYDPELGRFISADPFIQAPMNQQSLNRYSYVMNGPMSATDPSGYFKLKDLLNPFSEDNPIGIYSAATQIAAAKLSGLFPYMDYRILQEHDHFFERNPDLQFIPKIVSGVIACYFPALWWMPAVVDAHFTRINGGDTSDVLQSFVVGIATSYVSSEISGYYGNTYSLERVAAEGVMSGVTSELYGGDFWKGFEMGAGMGMLRYYYVKTMKYDVTWEQGHGLASENGKYDEDLGVPEDKQVFGTNEALNPDGKGNFWKQGGSLSNVANKIPGMNSLARLHDFYQISFGSPDSWTRAIFNVPAMVPATVVNYGALMTTLSNYPSIIESQHN